MSTYCPERGCYTGVVLTNEDGTLDKKGVRRGRVI